MRSPLPEGLIEDPLGFVRESCARVAGHASSVEIDLDRLRSWSDALPLDEIARAAPTEFPRGLDPEAACAFALQLDAVNFGSGWFPLLRKRPGLSGYRTVEASLIDHFRRRGAPSAAELTANTAHDCSRIFDQGAEADELMALFSQAWNDLGQLVRDRFDGRFSTLVARAGGSAKELVRTLLEMPFYRDIASHDGRPVAFLKRAQITASDLETASGGTFTDLDSLTIFADNLVPHVLRLDGVLCFEPDLIQRIESGARLEPGSPEEVEIRACALHSVELVAARCGASPRQLDHWLWARGGGAAYKARPRHRTCCVYY